ncbi:MAG: transcriptional repressor LexA [Calditrichia bacterium]|nr:transcriptional repressor LexA [Calditrichota bacterium]MCB0269820.1 transcriptional repressor LexA [Calditrichota bacterium]MCB0285124.1 transcriptional repressor LexA [Calditrichota bacterium]MCB9066799.1 transcriptional repressor LexA [Calditrichia bacterium]
MLESMTRQQREILRFIQGHLLVLDYPPSAADVMKAFTRRNPGDVVEDLKILEQRQTIEISGFTSVEFDLITIHPQFEDAEMKGMTQRQEEILRFIADYIGDRSYPPTYQEIADNFGIASKHGVVRHLEALEKKGKIARDGTTARGIRILDEAYLSGADDSEIARLPIIGRVAAGTPILANENIDDYVVVPRRMIRSEGNYFILRVQGESMINAGINDGDLVVVKSTQAAEHGQVVVALMNYDNEATVKRLIVRGKEKFLKAENPAIPDIYPQSEWSIQGCVVGLIRDLN